jgi:hypothetical protein
MHFLSVLIGVCSMIGATNAASVGETKSVKQIVNVSSECTEFDVRVLIDFQFDELEPCGFFDSPPFETAYKL